MAGQIDMSALAIRTYANESDLKDIIDLVSKDLSEPYSIFTYRFFINNWPELCQIVSAEIARQIMHFSHTVPLQAKIGDRTVGVVVGKQEAVSGRMQGYIAMVAVDKEYRKLGIGA